MGPDRAPNELFVASIVSIISASYYHELVRVIHFQSGDVDREYLHLQKDSKVSQELTHPRISLTEN